MFDFYALLLTLNITLGSVLLAVLLFYMQLVSSQYSPQIVPIVSGRAGTRAFVIATALGCALSLVAVTCEVLYSSSELLSGHPLWITAIGLIEGPAGVGLSAALLVLTVLMFVVAVRDYANSTDAGAVVRILAAQTTPELISQCCYNTYGHPSGATPDSVQPVLDQLHRLGFLKPPPDPLRVICEIASAAMNKHDLAAWDAACDGLDTVVAKWLRAELEELPQARRPAFHVQVFDPHFVRLIRDRLAFVQEGCRASGHSSAEAKVVEIWYWGAYQALAWGRPVILRGAVTELSEIGIRAAQDGRRATTIAVMERLTQLACILQAGGCDEQDVFNDAVRTIGGVGAILADREAPVPQAAQRYQTEVGNEAIQAVVASLSKIVDATVENSEAQLSTVLSDILCLLCQSMSGSRASASYRELILGLLASQFDLGIEACARGDIQCASVVVGSFELLFEIWRAGDAGHEFGSTAVHFAVDVACSAAAAPARAGGLAGDDTFMDCIADSLLRLDGPELRKAAYETVVHWHRPNYAAVHEFIKTVGHRLNHNFGLRFDPATREDYSVDSAK